MGWEVLTPKSSTVEKRKRSLGCFHPLERPSWEGKNWASPLPGWDHPRDKEWVPHPVPKEEGTQGVKGLALPEELCLCLLLNPGDTPGGSQTSAVQKPLVQRWPGSISAASTPSAELGWSGTPEMLQRLQRNSKSYLVSHAASRRDNTHRSQPGLTRYKLLFNCNWRNWLI